MKNFNNNIYLLVLFISTLFISCDTKKLNGEYELFYKFENIFYKSKSKNSYIIEGEIIRHINDNSGKEDSISFTFDDKKNILKTYGLDSNISQLLPDTHGLEYTIVYNDDNSVNYLKNQETNTYFLPKNQNTSLMQDGESIVPKLIDKNTIRNTPYLNVSDIYQNRNNSDILEKFVNVKGKFKIFDNLLGTMGFGIIFDNQDMNNRILVLLDVHHNQDYRKYLMEQCGASKDNFCDVIFSGQIVNNESKELHDVSPVLIYGSIQ